MIRNAFTRYVSRISFARALLIIAIGIGLICLLFYAMLNEQNANIGYSRIFEVGRTILPEIIQNRMSEPKYIVETPTCKIPEMDPWDKSISTFLKPDRGYPVDCRGTHRSWTYMNGTQLTLNRSAIHESGYSESLIRCCYRTIERVEQPLSDYDMNADMNVKYSDKCHSIKNEKQEIDAEFIRVHCISTSIPLLHDVVYRDFFAIVQPKSDRLVSYKLEKWKSFSKEKPPNVVIVGIDNNSRMNSYRTLTKTIAALRKMGAVEMLGYTKVAENTFPNSIAFLSGYNSNELTPICYSSDADPQDDCPYVWKAFHNASYITGHIEDTPYIGGFNYLKTGFLRKPTDFYLRPLMLAVHTYMPRSDYYHTDCIGRYMTEELMFNYILDLLQLSSAPVFAFSWLTSLAHLNYNNLKFGDDSVSHFLQTLKNTNDTIFFFMSDHGQRYGHIRETSQGWYEDKLPVQFIYIPPILRQRFPAWDSALRINSARLTSHFDVYKTLLHILKTFDENNAADDFYRRSMSQIGQSLFQLVPENRTCEQAGISVNFCACVKPETWDLKDPDVTAAAEAAVSHLAELVPKEVCAVPTLKTIVNVKYIRNPMRPVYLISLVTQPGDFLFEVNVEKVNDGRFVITTDLLRMNKITRPAKCVSTPFLERYCYCV